MIVYIFNLHNTLEKLQKSNNMKIEMLLLLCFSKSLLWHARENSQTKAKGDRRCVTEET